MSQSTHRALRHALASALVSAAVLLAVPQFASPAATPSQPPTLPTPSPKPNNEAVAKGMHADRVEARIKELHARLHITEAQQQQWDAVAQVIRDNAQSMDAAIAQRSPDAAGMNAVDDLRSYAVIVDAHADGLKKFIPVFQALYDSMSDAQKKSADAFFHGRMRTATTACSIPACAGTSAAPAR